MIKKVTERSSAFVVVSRKTLLGGMAGIAVVSFSLGYFLAYGGPSSDKLIKHVEADNKVVPSEEKTVLDSSGKPTIIMPPATPDAIPKEPVQRTPEQPKADQGKIVPKPEDIQKKPEAAVTPPAAKEAKKDRLLTEKRAQTNPAQPAEQAASKPVQMRPGNKITSQNNKQPENQAQSGTQAEKQSPVAAKDEKKDVDQPKLEIENKSLEKPTKKSRHKVSQKKSLKKSYALQVGAFADAQKARRLKEDLDGKGYKTYIMTYSSEKGKTFSRVRIGPYETKDQALEAIPELKDQGLEGVIVPGRR